MAWVLGKFYSCGPFLYNLNKNVNALFCNIADLLIPPIG